MSYIYYNNRDTAAREAMLLRYVMSQVKHNSYFLVGLLLGLWLALATVPLETEGEACAAAAGASEALPLRDDYEPVREERPLGAGSGGAGAGRSVQRPRYYSSELGVRGALLAGVLSDAETLATRGAALNRTAALLQPALRFFIAASAPRAVPAANVVGFTDAREMLKPFHALKYLADNYLEEYDFFFLVSDATYINARRLLDLTKKLSVSQDVYMGAIADDETHYCSLESGILLSNSVLRAVHGELDWCVRNSYSPHHHENIGRCVLHAAHVSCMNTLQGSRYVSVRIEEDADVGVALTPALGEAVTAARAASAEALYQLHAYASREQLQRDAAAARALRRAVWAGARRLPPGFRNATWPAGLRADVGLAPPPPDSRFDYLRWTRFNETHAFFPDDRHAVVKLAGAHREALDSALAWAARRWQAGWGSARVVEGAWRWEPAAALRYVLLLTDGARVRQLEVCRVLGAARLVPAPYVTESARVHVVLPVPLPARALPAFLQRYRQVALDKDRNTALSVVLLRESGVPDQVQRDMIDSARSSVAALGQHVTVLEADSAGGPHSPAAERTAHAARAALLAARPGLAPDELLLLTTPAAEFNEDFLNRVRMNTIMGWQWFLCGAFSRHAQLAHPRFRDAAQDTGRFNLRHTHSLAVYKKDLDDALQSWRGGAEWSAAEVLAASSLRALLAPEPALVVAPPPPPCRDGDGAAAAGGDVACLLAERRARFADLDLGAPHALAKMMLEINAEKDM